MYYFYPFNKNEINIQTFISKVSNSKHINNVDSWCPEEKKKIKYCSVVRVTLSKSYTTTTENLGVNLCVIPPVGGRGERRSLQASR